MLSKYDMLIGLGVREILFMLGLESNRWRVVDLKPPKKSQRLNRSGEDDQLI
jgi:hypothetical protein